MESGSGKHAERSDYDKELHQASCYKNLTQDELKALVQRAKTGDMNSLQLLFLSYKKQVVAIGRNKLGAGYQGFSDFCQDCFLVMAARIGALRNELAIGVLLRFIAREVAAKHRSDPTYTTEPRTEDSLEHAEALNQERDVPRTRDSKDSTEGPRRIALTDDIVQKVSAASYLEAMLEAMVTEDFSECVIELKEFLSHRYANDLQVYNLFILKYQYLVDGRNTRDHKFQRIAMAELNTDKTGLRNVTDRLNYAIRKGWPGYQKLLELLQPQSGRKKPERRNHGDA